MTANPSRELRMTATGNQDTRPGKTDAVSRQGFQRAATSVDAGGTASRIELYQTGLSHTMPFETVPDEHIEFVGEFDSLEQAAEYADCNGCGWYLWSEECHGRYLGTICVVQGSKPETREF